MKRPLFFGKKSFSRHGEARTCPASLVRLNGNARFVPLLFAVAFHIGAAAQATYTTKLRKAEPGQGAVVIVQSEEIERIVNSPLARQAPPAGAPQAESAVPRKDATAAAPHKEIPHSAPNAPHSLRNPGHATAQPSAGAAGGKTVAHRHVDRLRYKAQGFRICIYTGGNSRKDRAAAVKMGDTCRRYFGELAAYTSFESPRWVTHVGDFRTREEAQKYVNLIRRKHFTYEVRIVRSEVNLPYRDY